MWKNVRKIKAFLIKALNWAASRWATQIHWVWDDDEVQGTVRVTRGGYGAYVSLPEICGPDADVALFDLYYRSVEGSKVYPEQPYVVQIYGQGQFYDDPVYQHFYETEEA